MIAIQRRMKLSCLSEGHPGTNGDFRFLDCARNDIGEAALWAALDSRFRGNDEEWLAVPCSGAPFDYAQGEQRRGTPSP